MPAIREAASLARNSTPLAMSPGGAKATQRDPVGICFLYSKRVARESGICAVSVVSGAVFDVSVAPAREQWHPDTNLLDLNPAGRLQTTKRRDIIPASTVMQEWLAVTKDWFVCTDKQERVASVRSAWDTARTTLDIPKGRGPKYLRHSVATILANRRVPPYEISLVLGHQVLDPTTETYFVHDPLYLQGFLSGVEAVMADLQGMVPDALHPNFTRKS